MSINFDMVPNGGLTVIIPGDVNSDKKVNMIDALLVAHDSAGTGCPEGDGPTLM